MCGGSGLRAFFLRHPASAKREGAALRWRFGNCRRIIGWLQPIHPRGVMAAGMMRIHADVAPSRANGRIIMTTRKFLTAALLGISAIGLSACEKNTPAENTADAVEDQADIVREQGDAKADAMENTADTLDDTADAVDTPAEQNMENRAQATREAADAKADAMEDKADKID
jgi:hypothetical protein